MSESEITKILISANEEYLDCTEDSNDFWLALAKAQWEFNSLDKEVYSKVENIIKLGENYRVWREDEASEFDLKKREKALEKFLIKLQTEREKPNKRKKVNYSTLSSRKVTA